MAKEEIYRSKLKTLEELKTEIRVVLLAINIHLLIRKCIDNSGAFVEYLVNKMVINTRLINKCFHLLDFALRISVTGIAQIVIEGKLQIIINWKKER